MSSRSRHDILYERFLQRISQTLSSRQWTHHPRPRRMVIESGSIIWLFNAGIDGSTGFVSERCASILKNAIFPAVATKGRPRFAVNHWLNSAIVLPDALSVFFRTRNRLPGMEEFPE